MIRKKIPPPGDGSSHAELTRQEKEALFQEMFGQDHVQKKRRQLFRSGKRNASRKK